MTQRFEYLNLDEQNKIKLLLRSSYITSGCIGFIIIVIMHLFYFGGNTVISIFYLELLSSIIIIGVIFLTRIQNNNLRNDLNQGLKIIKEYNIENKVSYENNNPGLGGYSTKYYFIAESRQIFVDKEMFETAKIGDKLLEHMTPNEEEILKIETKKRSIL